MRGQLSAEMLIVLVLVLGLAILLFTQMQSTGEKFAKAAEKKTDTALNAMEKQYCTNDEQCEKLGYSSCIDNYCE